MGRKEVRVAEINLKVSDGELMRISSERVLALSLKEMKALQAYAEDLRVREERKKVGLGENLTDCEVEAIAQTWSEHCKHKIFNARIDYHDEEGKSPAHRQPVRHLHQAVHRRDPQGHGGEGLVRFGFQG